MTENTERDDTGDDLPRRAATAGRKSLTQRLTATARGARLLRSPRRRQADEARSRTGEGTDVPRLVRQRVLRGYHAANLVKARQASEELVRAGWNTGAVPYGYRPQRVRISPHGRRPRWRTRLVIEPVEAAVVKMIFTWRVQDRLPVGEIRRLLAESRYPAPLDPNTGQPSVWTRAVVRAILRNPKYTGQQIWGRRHHGQRVPRPWWVWSETMAHTALIDHTTFAAAQQTVRPPASRHHTTGVPGDRAA